jgi:hypothetical protein
MNSQHNPVDMNMVHADHDFPSNHLPCSANQMEPMEAKQPDNQINIELSEEIAEGTYSNLAIITHSNAEFVIDFVRIMPGVPKAKVKSRIVLTPEHAKRLLLALGDNVQKYEEANGTIETHDNAPPFPMNFGGPTAQA